MLANASTQILGRPFVLRHTILTTCLPEDEKAFLYATYRAFVDEDRRSIVASSLPSIDSST